MIDNSAIVQDEKIYELTDIFDEQNEQISLPRGAKKSQEAIDGPGYELAKHEFMEVHELTEVVADELSSPEFNDAVMKQAAVIIEKIAREVVPEIAERLIGEEIKKIKGKILTDK